MSLGIQGLSDELVVCMTGLLARRPEYGIAIPSRRWLQRQQEKIGRLPKELLKPTNPLKRLAMKIADVLDPDIADPQAVLCKTHATLNPFLIRRLFMALAYEVTVHTDPIRSWGGRTSTPELSAFVGRLDSIAALWTEPALFTHIYGLAPFEGRHVFVRSGCEACCLAAVGASGRALADLRAALIDRMERRKGSPQRRAKQPRLFRVVEAWIDHLRKGKEDISRSEGCRALSETLLTELRTARPYILTWRDEQKQLHASLRASERPVFSELRTTSNGHVVVALPAKYGHKRRTRHGIPVAMADIEGAESQRRAAAFNSSDNDSIYRPDSLSGNSVVSQRQRVAYSLPIGARPGAPEPARLSGPSDGSPTPSFVNRFEQELALDDEEEIDPYEDLDDGQDLENERDRIEERSRRKVQQWWTKQVAGSQRDLNLSQDDARSMLSMVHPAFRPIGSRIAESALPGPLRAEKSHHEQQQETDGDDAVKGVRGGAASEWTDWTVHTVDPEFGETDLTEAPPVPRVPSKYRNIGRFGNETPTPPPGVSSTPTLPLSSARPSPTSHDPRQSTSPFPAYVDPLDDPTASSSPKPGAGSLNWPAPPQGRPTPPATTPNSNDKNKPDPKRYLFVDSEVGSTAYDGHQRAYVRNRHTMRDSLPPEKNPFLNGGDSGRGSGSNWGSSRTRTSVCAATRRMSASSSVYSVMSDGTPVNGHQGQHAKQHQDEDSLHPHDSASCSQWAPKNQGSGEGRDTDYASSITQFRDFM